MKNHRHPPKREKQSLFPDPVIDLIGDPFIEQIVPLLWKKALQTHRQLPLGHRIWIEPEDLFQEAYLEAIRCFRLWESERNIKFITFVYQAVDNRMASLLVFWKAKKRYPGVSVDLSKVDIEQKQFADDSVIDAVMRLLFSGA